MSQAPSNTASAQTSKRPSPPTTQPPAKKQKNDTPSGAGAGAGGGAGGAAQQGGGNSAGQNTLDPDQLSDALLAAGIDLKDEETRMQNELQAEAMYARERATALPKMSQEFLQLDQLRKLARKLGQDEGITVNIDKESELTQMLQLSCHEWMISIITDMVALNRHRRRSRNDAHSEIGRALRTLAIKDKEAEDRRIAHKTVMGLETGENEKKAGSEETQYRNANATASMMTGKKKYSWMAGGGGGGAGGAGGGAAGAGGGSGGQGSGGAGALAGSAGSASSGSRGSRNDMNIRYREAREEPQLSLRDLMGSLEDRRHGVERTMMKGYARMKN